MLTLSDGTLLMREFGDTSPAGAAKRHAAQVMGGAYFAIEATWGFYYNARRVYSGEQPKPFEKMCAAQT